MMKFSFRRTVKIKVKGKCPVRPRYNPELGKGQIKGACKTCTALFEVTDARDKLHAAAKKLEELAEPYLVVSTLGPNWRTFHGA